MQPGFCSESAILNLQSEISNQALLKLQSAVETFIRVLYQQKKQRQQTGKRGPDHRNKHRPQWNGSFDDAG